MKHSVNWITLRDISSPGELADVSKSVVTAVRNGGLIQVTPSDTLFSSPLDILQIAPDGPWPDYLELHFKEPQTTKRFRLVAETYHGAGGRWEVAVDPPAGGN